MRIWAVSYARSTMSLVRASKVDSLKYIASEGFSVKFRVALKLKEPEVEGKVG